MPSVTLSDQVMGERVKSGFEFNALGLGLSMLLRLTVERVQVIRGHVLDLAARFDSG